MKQLGLNFIVATGRTGSTLLSTMLNSHPNIISINEEPFCLNLYDGYKNVSDWNEELIKKFVKDFLLFSSGKLGPQFSTPQQLEKILMENRAGLDYQAAIRLCYFAFFPLKDKTDIQMLASKELIFHTQMKKLLRIFPDSKFVLLVRDPRDNILVKIKRAEKRNAAYSLDHFTIGWKVLYSMLLNKLSKYGKGRFLIVKYETLVSDAENELKKVCEFLGIIFHPQMLEYDQLMKNEWAKKEEGLPDRLKQQIAREHEGLTKKVYTDKIGFWKTNLKPEQVNRIWTVDGDLAEKFGYQVHEGFQQNKPGIDFKFRYLYFLVRTIMVPSFYYQIPWFIRKALRKMKYGQSYIESGYKDKGFYGK